MTTIMTDKAYGCYETETGRICPTLHWHVVQVNEANPAHELWYHKPCGECGSYLASGVLIGLGLLVLGLCLFVTVRNAAIRRFGGERYRLGWNDCAKQTINDVRVMMPEKPNK